MALSTIGVNAVSFGAGDAAASSSSIGSTSVKNLGARQCLALPSLRIVANSQETLGFRFGAWQREVGRIARATGRGDSNRDDEGVIKDMELYLDDLSLEYDSVWDTKPSWCQPWTIVGTGVGVVGGSWLVLHNLFVTGGVSMVISFWWFSFLYAYPLAYAEMIAQRRKMVEDGSEDTYGRKKE